MKTKILLMTIALLTSLSTAAQATAWQNATMINNGTSVSSKMVESTIHWYKIVLPDAGNITFTTTSDATLRLGGLNVYVLNAEGKELIYRSGKDMDGYGEEGAVKEFTLEGLAAGTYYISLGYFTGYGGYRLTYQWTANTNYKDDAEPNNVWTQATLIENGGLKVGRMGYYYYGPEEKDVIEWFKIVLPDDGRVTFTTTSDAILRLGGLNVYVLNAEGKQLIYRSGKDMDGYGKNDSTIVYTMDDIAAGTYYISLAHFTGYGGYRLTYQWSANSNYGNGSDPNNTWQEALPLTNGMAHQNHFGYWNGKDDRDLLDWYRIELPADGRVTFSTTSDATLRLGGLIVNVLNDEENELIYRSFKDMDGYGKNDSTVVYTMDDIAAGTYYIRLAHYIGYGGYKLAYNYQKNSYTPDTDCPSFATRRTLEEGETVYNTLGYRRLETNTEDWYDLGTIANKQIDITIVPDTSRSVQIGIMQIFKYQGDDPNGNPILEDMANTRIERSRATLSYIDKTSGGAHYVVKVPLSSGTGGYSLTYGDEQKIIDQQAYGSDIAIMTGGRNTVRKGVPCENTITVSNLSDKPSDFFMLVIEPTEDYHIIGFRMPLPSGSEYIPADSVTIPEYPTCLFFVPRLEPWESYTFTMISEGVGDIAYAPQHTEVLTNGPRKIVLLSAGITVAAIGAFAKTAATSLLIGAGIDLISKAAGDAIFPSDSEEAQNYAKLMGSTVNQLGIRSSWDSPTVYTGKSVVTTATTEYIKKVIPKTGTPMNIIGNVGFALSNIIPNLRRRIWSWIYKDLGYYDNYALFDAKRAVTDVVASWDPNEMVGPQGVGEKHYIGETTTMNYRILFENKAEAGAPAYRVRISDELDESVFDVSTVKFGETSHDGPGYKWIMSREGNKLSWDIEGIELPPNVNAPEGEGFVSFSVDLKKGLASGTQLKNKATIIFDKNYPIETNEYVNTLDLLPPTTVMINAGKVKEDTVQVVCQSTDAESGTGYYLLYAAKGQGAFEYQGQYFTNTMMCPVSGDAMDYRFFALAVDAVGNTEQVIPAYIPTTEVDPVIIVDVNGDGQTNNAVYNLSGQKLSTPQKGINIIRMSDGTTRKVLIGK